jgi:hypothetical protein
MSLTTSRLGIALAATLAIMLSGIGLAAHASDKSDAETLVAKAKTTIQSVAGDSDFASLRPRAPDAVPMSPLISSSIRRSRGHLPASRSMGRCLMCGRA